MNPALLAICASAFHLRTLADKAVEVGYRPDRHKDYAEYPFLTRWRLRYIRDQVRRGARKRALTGTHETMRETRLWAEYFRLLEGKKR